MSRETFSGRACPTFLAAVNGNFQARNVGQARPLNKAEPTGLPPVFRGYRQAVPPDGCE